MTTPNQNKVAATLLALALLALLALAFVASARPVSAAEPIPCEWYPPGWPLTPDWDSTEWSVLVGTPEECAAIQAAWDATPAPDAGQPAKPQITPPPTDTGPIAGDEPGDLALLAAAALLTLALALTLLRRPAPSYRLRPRRRRLSSRARRAKGCSFSISAPARRPRRLG